MRSFDEPPGLRYSTFASTVHAMPSLTLLSLTRGVFPTRSRMVSAYFIVRPIYPEHPALLRGDRRVGQDARELARGSEGRAVPGADLDRVRDAQAITGHPSQELRWEEPVLGAQHETG